MDSSLRCAPIVGGARAWAALLVATLCALTGCEESASHPTEAVTKKPQVFAANPPLASLVQQLAGDAVTIITPWRAAGGDPAYWTPSANDLRAIQACDLVVLNGAGYEPWAEQVALSRARTLDTTESVASLFISQPGETHTHGPEGAHAHRATAFTTWLSPTIARAQTASMAERLSQLLPQQALAIEQRLAAITTELEALDGQLKQIARTHPHWLASHPVYQYLAQAAGFEIASVHWEAAEMPPDEEWQKLRALSESTSESTHLMLWEGEPSPEIRAKLEAMHIEVVVFSPLGLPDEHTSFMRSLTASVSAMQRAAGAHG